MSKALGPILLLGGVAAIYFLSKKSPNNVLILRTKPKDHRFWDTAPFGTLVVSVSTTNVSNDPIVYAAGINAAKKNPDICFIIGQGQEAANGTGEWSEGIFAVQQGEKSSLGWGEVAPLFTDSADEVPSLIGSAILGVKKGSS